MGVILMVEHYAVGMCIAWKPYLLNELIYNYVDAQDNGTDFQYKWIIIPTSMIAFLVLPKQYFTPPKNLKFMAPRQNTLSQ